MCGICGIVALENGRTPDAALVKAMADSIAHRGPDDDGMLVAGSAVFGHRRLSIIDLASGKQPIGNEDGSVSIVFNGEIYNYRELRAELLARGHRFQTHSDTEVIVHLYEEYGPGCVARLHGMFAFAIWDERNKTAFLARDRVGIKPFYYTVCDGELVFGSEIKALLKHPSVETRVDPQVVDLFLMFLFCPGRDTAIKGIHRLLPGHYLLVRDGKVSTVQYWDLRFEPNAQRSVEARAAEELVALLDETVRGHMISDVPVGVLLSGGVDSTAMLSFAVAHTDQPVNTFTVGFADSSVTDERPYARLAAQRYGSVHHEMTVSAEDFRAFLPKYVWHMEEPVCEPPAVALYYVTELASRHVKVLLSGEGGDEGFAGYQTYRNLIWLERLKAAGRLPARAAAAGLDLLARASGKERWQRLAHVLRNDLADYYWSRTSGPFSVLARAKPTLYTEAFRSEIERKRRDDFVGSLFGHVRNESKLNQMLYVDTKTWLPDDLLIKADKMTMANSVELRVPLLDHRVLEFAGSLAQHLKVRGFRTKHLLKQALRDRVPREILDRPKTGFPVPFRTWFRGPLRDFVHDVLQDPRTRGRGYFNDSAVHELLGLSDAGRDVSAEIFSLVTLELWHREFIDKDHRFGSGSASLGSMRAAASASVTRASGASTAGSNEPRAGNAF